MRRSLITTPSHGRTVSSKGVGKKSKCVRVLVGVCVCAYVCASGWVSGSRFSVAPKENHLE